MIRVGLVGARGYVGRELIRVLDSDERFTLAFAGSREMAGRPIGAGAGFDGLRRLASIEAEALSPEDIARRDSDVIVLGLPNGMAQPYVDALGAAGSRAVVVDLSADYRHREGWVYGAPEIFADAIRRSTRIANPGCYATAANLALWPLRKHVAGHVSVFGLSGFSGAGTTPTPRNDPERLEANALPYGFGGHGHQAEIAGLTGLDIVFAPHVAPFFRGLITTLTVPLVGPMDVAAIRGLFEEAYAGARNVVVTREPPEIRSAAGGDSCVIGGFALDRAGRILTFTSALDNLRKGAATQALENIELALGLA